MATVEFLRARRPSPTGEAILSALVVAAKEAGDTVHQTTSYRGSSDWLVLFGVGAAVNHQARRQQLARGAHALLWDLGYMQRRKVTGYLRMSIDHDHPQGWLDATQPQCERFDALGVALGNDFDAAGRVLLIGLGRKSRAYLKLPHWERAVFDQLRARFGTDRILHRPKGQDDDVRLPCERDCTTPIQDLLRGAALVVCRHSNVAVDAAIAGVPFEAQDGAAAWLARRPFTPETRLDFLRRLAWWQWKPAEATEAWAFAKGIVG